MKRKYGLAFLFALVCLLCGAIFCACDPAEGDRPHTHEYVLAAGDDAKRNCFFEGEAWEYCSCGAKQKTVMTARGHDYGAWEPLREPDCLNVGLEQRTCTRCGVTEEQVSSAMLSHEYFNGRCVTCGRKDWAHAEIDDPDLYSGEYAFLGLADLPHGVQMQTLYREIEADARGFHVSGESSLILGEYDYQGLGLTVHEVAAVWKAFLDDHPLYYWLSRALKNGETAVIQIDEEYANPYTRAEINDLIYTTAKAWREDASENAYLAALCYHDKILQAVDYAYEDNKKPSTEAWAHNIVGVFQAKGAVCEGYARAFQLLLNASGIDNIFVTGTSTDVPHAWNLVQLDDGKWYWADLTYDDGIFRTGSNYNFFLVSENANVNVRDYGWGGEAKTFADFHTVTYGTDENYTPALPARAQTAYQSAVTLLLRDTFTVGKNTYALEGDKSVRLTKSYEMGDVSVPETVTYCGTEYTVTSLGGIEEGLFDATSQVFQNSVTSVYLPKSIRFLSQDSVDGFRIKEYRVSPENVSFCAVDGVLYTKSLYTLVKYPAASDKAAFVMPNETVQIAYRAFYSGMANTALKSFTVGSNFQLLGIANWGSGWNDSHNTVSDEWAALIGAFPKLEEVTFFNNPYFSYTGGVVYSANKEWLYAAFPWITSVTVPATVKAIDSSAFTNCFKLEQVYFERDCALTEIGYNAFRFCQALKEISLPEGLVKIGESAFQNCSMLASITLPRSLQSIEAGAFQWCTNLTAAVYAGSREEWQGVSKGDEWQKINVSYLEN